MPLTFRPTPTVSATSATGRERERFSDPDASLGASLRRLDQKRRRVLWVQDPRRRLRRDGPAARVAHRNRAAAGVNFVAPLLDALQARGFQPETCAMDKGYDNNRVYAECEERGCEPVIPLRGARGKQPAMLGLGGRYFPRIQRHTQRFRDLYRGRAAVERALGDLKHDYGLAPLRVRGLERVQLHADLTMLARLAQALTRAREAPLAHSRIRLASSLAIGGIHGL